MVGEFFIRFNLHNSICNYPASFDVLKPLVDISDEELEACLDNIERVHAKRAEMLSQSHVKEINALLGKKVLFLGDSLTSDNFGYRRTVTKAAELEALDGSVSGGTSAAILHSSRMQLHSFKPNIVSLMIGANDSVSIDSEGMHQVGIEEYERNVRAMVGWALKANAKVLLLEITPVHEERFARSFTSQYKLQSNDNIKRYNCVLKNIANEYRIPLFSHSWIAKEDVNSIYEPDGIHLSLRGQELFARNWLTSAAKIINTKEQSI